MCTFLGILFMQIIIFSENKASFISLQQVSILSIDLSVYLSIYFALLHQLRLPILWSIGIRRVDIFAFFPILSISVYTFCLVLFYSFCFFAEAFYFSICFQNVHNCWLEYVYRSSSSLHQVLPTSVSSQRWQVLTFLSCET